MKDDGEIIKYMQVKYINVFEAIDFNLLKGKSVIYINPYNYFHIKKEVEFLENVFYRTDGIFVTLFIKVLNRTKYKVKRQSLDMTSLAPVIFNYAIRNQLSLYFCGGNNSEIEIFVRKIEKLYPELKIHGYMSGYHDETEIIKKIENINCDIVFLGLGNKKQETILIKLSKHNKKISYFSCGAFISQTARSRGIEYYPNFINKFHLRWMYRFIHEKYIIKRVFLYYPYFLFAIFVDYFQMRLNERKKK